MCSGAGMGTMGPSRLFRTLVALSVSMTLGVLGVSQASASAASRHVVHHARAVKHKRAIHLRGHQERAHNSGQVPIVQSLINDPFTGPTTSAPVVEPTNNTRGFPCLTAGTNPASTPVAGCNLATPDPSGAGVLRFTNTGGFEASAILYDNSLPTADGLSITYRDYQYGGNGADGISFDLAVAPPQPTTVGASGGYLGYSGSPGGLGAGLPGGWLGIGLDAWGNYTNPAFDGSGCTVPKWAGFKKNEVTVRGPGNGTTGYCLLSSSAQSASGGLPFLLRGTSRADSLRSVHIEIDPASATYSVGIDPTGGTSYTTVTGGSLPTSYYSPTTGTLVSGVPARITFGWAASTGGENDYHEISGLVATTLNSTVLLPVLGLTKTDSVSRAPAVGSTFSYTITPSVLSSGGTETQPTTLTVSDPLPMGITPTAIPSGTSWNCSASTSTTVSCAYTGTAPIPAHTTLGAITVPVKLAPNVTTGTKLTNTASVLSDDATLPVTASDAVTVAPGVVVTPTSVATTLSGGNKSGTAIAVSPSTSVTDSATLMGANASSGTGTVTYTVYSNSGCTTVVNTGTAKPITKAGTLPASNPVTLATAGTYYWQASYSGDTKNLPSKSMCGTTGEVETVTNPRLTTTLATSLSGGSQHGLTISVPTSTSVSDQATLSGANAAIATGTVTYDVYSNSTCTTAVSNGTAETITSPGTLPASNPVLLMTPGTYYWQASYSGDPTKNLPSKSTCGLSAPSAEIETVVATTPTSITTSLSVPGRKYCRPWWGFGWDPCHQGGGNGYGSGDGRHDNKIKVKTKTAHKSRNRKACGDRSGGSGWSNGSDCGGGGAGGGQSQTTLTVPDGTAVTDAATLSGTNASTATGTLTYNVFSNNTCTGSATATGGTVTITAGRVPSSNPATLNPGTYYWQASYSGDSANSPSVSMCGSEVETVKPAPTQLTTMLVGAGAFGGGSCWWLGDAITVFSGASVTDSATLSGANASSAGGTVTYTVYADSWHQTVAGNGGTFSVTDGSIPNSNPITLTTPGTYFWQATYSGDSLNAPASSSWGSETEVVRSVPKCKYGWNYGWNGGCSSGGNGNGGGDGHGSGFGGFGHWW